MKKHLYLFFCLFFLVAVGCASNHPSPKGKSAVVVTDSLGHTVEMEELPKKVVILSPTLADMYHGVGGDIAGISYMPGRSYPEYVMKAEYIGLPHTINIEKVISLKPDIVLGMNALHNRYADILEQNQIPFLLFDVAQYDDVKKTISTMATLAGHEEEGKKMLTQMDKTMEDTAKRYAKEPLTYAAIHGTGQGISLEVKGSIVCDVADRLGLSNVFSEFTMKDIGDKPPFSMESLTVKNPDVIFLTTMVQPGMEEEIFEKALFSQPAWQTMKAVKNHRVYILPQCMFLSSPGIDYPKALDYMAKRVYEKE